VIAAPKPSTTEAGGEATMILITNLSQFNKAKLRASAGKLTATTSTVWRVYRVTNEEKGVTYRVSFWRGRDGRRWTTCECAGGQAGFVCKHMGKAISLHLELMLTVEGRAERKAAAAAPPRYTPNPAFDEEDANIPDADAANWQ
jgi:hypothetical protein